MRCHIDIDDRQASVGRRTSTLRMSDGQSQALWFAADRPLSTDTADAFVLASLPFWMRHGGSVHVHGVVTRRLLAGLEEWQAAWGAWLPEEFRHVELTADDVSEARPSGDQAVLAFSGGLDAAYSARRHLTNSAGWRRADLVTGALIQGADTPDDTFARAKHRAEAMLTGSDIELSTVATNVAHLGSNWEHVFGVSVAAVLTLFAPERSVGLIGSSEPYTSLVLPWGSNPITDPLTSSGHIEIRHDGAHASRTEKAAVVAEWPEALEHLLVCFAGSAKDRNCGQCEKCIRTILNFRIVGAGLPACFPADVDDTRIRSVEMSNPAVVNEWASMVAAAENRGIDASWLAAMRSAIRRNKVRQRARGVPLLAESYRRLRHHR